MKQGVLTTASSCYKMYLIKRSRLRLITSSLSERQLTAYAGYYVLSLQMWILILKRKTTRVSSPVHVHPSYYGKPFKKIPKIRKLPLLLISTHLFDFKYNILLSSIFFISYIPSIKRTQINGWTRTGELTLSYSDVFSPTRFCFPTPCRVFYKYAFCLRGSLISVYVFAYVYTIHIQVHFDWGWNMYVTWKTIDV